MFSIQKKGLGKYIGKILNSIKTLISKIPFLGKKLANKIAVNALTNLFVGATVSITVNKILGVLVKNIDIMLSLGGLIAGILDWAVDGELDGKIVI